MIRVIKSCYSAGYFSNGYEVYRTQPYNESHAFFIDGYWVYTDTYEKADKFFERWKKLKAFL